jgi:hypothetical protein
MNDDFFYDPGFGRQVLALALKLSETEPTFTNGNWVGGLEVIYDGTRGTDVGLALALLWCSKGEGHPGSFTIRSVWELIQREHEEGPFVLVDDEARPDQSH